MVTPVDTIYPNQWHYDLIGDIETIWDEFTGIGVSLGIYSDGVQASHADLDGNYNAALAIWDSSELLLAGTLIYLKTRGLGQLLPELLLLKIMQLEQSVWHIMLLLLV
jgi:hypothetical protein